MRVRHEAKNIVGFKEKNIGTELSQPRQMCNPKVKQVQKRVGSIIRLSIVVNANTIELGNRREYTCPPVESI
jgi:hypothetical protein